jgi:hypothetical protein
VKLGLGWEDNTIMCVLRVSCEDGGLTQIAYEKVY